MPYPITYINCSHKCLQNIDYGVLGKLILSRLPLKMKIGQAPLIGGDLDFINIVQIIHVTSELNVNGSAALQTSVNLSKKIKTYILKRTKKRMKNERITNKNIIFIRNFHNNLKFK